MGKGSELRHARAGLARDDERLLSQHHVAVPAQGRIRQVVRVQNSAWHSDFRAGAGDRGAMNAALIDKIANSILYEGYMLYPYRRSSIKNRHRWNFGIVYPEGYNSEPTTMTTECLVSGEQPAVAVEV